ncbi:unnamed protein product [Mycena citricolor]|uniref:Tc1-like transposase DDE domain-containing protein n=1 Tax=Mycena citricolor TaxID=2018698 RepID=A0AAD2GWK0_9AGAR|nr:unnamed protein product [Mycena citricolor]
MGHYLTPTKCDWIVQWRKEGKTHNWIREHLTSRHNISDSQIYQIERDYTEKENYYDKGHCSGCPAKLRPRDVRNAVCHLSNQSINNATQLQREFFPEVSVQTVKRGLHAIGLQAHICCVVPFIPKHNLRVRMQWAESFLNWTVKDWRRVYFSDESIFCVFGSDGAEWCWRQLNKCLNPRFTKKKVKGGREKVTVWGMITLEGLGRLVHIEGNMDKFLYRDILQDNFLRSLDDLNLDLCGCYFQQDNDPKHTARIVSEWFHENSIDVLPWPATSPDMNIIEHVWDHLDHMVRARRPLPLGEKDLWQALQKEWVRMEKVLLQCCTSPCPGGCAHFMRQKGEHPLLIRFAALSLYPSQKHVLV